MLILFKQALGLPSKWLVISELAGNVPSKDSKLFIFFTFKVVLLLIFSKDIWSLKNILVIFTLYIILLFFSDLADWLGVEETGLFNFKPSVRPVPLEVHIQASN